MKKTILIFSIVLALISCSPSFQVLKHHDKFNPGWEMIYTTPIEVESGSFVDLTSLNMQFAFNYSDSSAYYTIAFTFLGENWMFVNGSKILIDGEVIELEPTIVPKREVIYAGFVKESIGFYLPQKIINLMKVSKNIDFRVSGSKGTIDFSFDKKIKNQFLTFLKQCNSTQIK